MKKFPYEDNSFTFIFSKHSVKKLHFKNGKNNEFRIPKNKTDVHLISLYYSNFKQTLLDYFFLDSQKILINTLEDGIIITENITRSASLAFKRVSLHPNLIFAPNFSYPNNPIIYQ